MLYNVPIHWLLLHTHTHILVYIPLQIPWITHTIHYILLVMAQCLFLTTIVETWLPIFLSLFWGCGMHQKRRKEKHISFPFQSDMLDIQQNKCHLSRIYKHHQFDYKPLTNIFSSKSAFWSHVKQEFLSSAASMSLEMVDLLRSNFKRGHVSCSSRSSATTLNLTTHRHNLSSPKCLFCEAVSHWKGVNITVVM